MTTTTRLAYAQPPLGRRGRPKGRISVWIAWSLWLLVWPILILGQVLEAKTTSFGSSPDFVVIGGLYATVGAIIATWEPRNAIGWLCLAVGVLGGLEGFVVPYASYALVDRPGSLPGGLVMAWVSLWLSYVWVLTFTFVPLLFPTGRLPSPRWRPVAWVNQELGAYLAAAGLLGHAAWDAYHHRVNRVVVCSMAEFCLVLDTVLAVAIVIMTVPQ